MSWNKGGKGGGPWGGAPGGGSGASGGGGSKRPPQPPHDFDEFFRRGKDGFSQMFPGGNDNKKSAMLLVLGALFLWLASGIYKVETNELGIVLRFGEFTDATEPGLRYHLPWPIEMVQTLPVTDRNTIEVGFRSRGTRTGEDTIPQESLMLTGDQNIVEITFDVQWKIKNMEPEAFLFNVRNPASSVKPVAESAIREVVGKIPIATALSEGTGKLKIEQDVQGLIQSTLDTYGAGIEVIKVNLLTADPPPQVIDSFRDVKTAEQDKQTQRNQAEAYRNEVIPKARGDAERMIREAEGYKEAVVKEAEGNASRFVAVYNEYRQAKNVTRKRMYLETMEKVMGNTRKLIIDKNAGTGVLPYLPLDELKPAAGRGAGGR